MARSLAFCPSGICSDISRTGGHSRPHRPGGSNEEAPSSSRGEEGTSHFRKRAFQALAVAAAAPHLVGIDFFVRIQLAGTLQEGLCRFWIGGVGDGALIDRTA